MDAHPSPYLSNSRRLPDVLAAIQLMGAYTFSSLKYEAWVDKLGGPLSAKDWRVIFSEHPEFFRLSDEWVSLRWRHGYDRTYSHEQGRDLTHDEISTLGEDQRGKLTRKPLTSDQLEALMKTAIELHSREIAHQQERRWLSPLLFGLLGIVLGSILQAALK
ncbi:hypothetical protein [Rhizobacter sp. LjRoot28]|jgi:hypothetical protein|uniref:hypothetical protein n=1 Tax=Rhizobacter sp. LjRoot28 TaxID=3342309 RepID=UPI003ED0C892